MHYVAKKSKRERKSCDKAEGEWVPEAGATACEYWMEYVHFWWMDRWMDGWLDGWKIYKIKTIVDDVAKGKWLAMIYNGWIVCWWTYYTVWSTHDLAKYRCGCQRDVAENLAALKLSLRSRGMAVLAVLGIWPAANTSASGILLMVWKFLIYGSVMLLSGIWIETCVSAELCALIETNRNFYYFLRKKMILGYLNINIVKIPLKVIEITYYEIYHYLWSDFSYDL